MGTWLSHNLDGSHLYRCLNQCVPDQAVWTFHCSSSVKAPLHFSTSARSHHPITAKQRADSAKWVSACLCDDGWASVERWWMTAVAIFVWRYTEQVPMVTLSLLWPLLEPCQIGDTLSHVVCHQESKNICRCNRRYLANLEYKIYWCHFSQATQTTSTSDWFVFFFQVQNSNKLC